MELDRISVRAHEGARLLATEKRSLLQVWLYATGNCDQAQSFYLGLGEGREAINTWASRGINLYQWAMQGRGSHMCPLNRCKRFASPNQWVPLYNTTFSGGVVAEAAAQATTLARNRSHAPSTATPSQGFGFLDGSQFLEVSRHAPYY